MARPLKSPPPSTLRKTDRPVTVIEQSDGRFIMLFHGEVISTSGFILEHEAGAVAQLTVKFDGEDVEVIGKYDR
jgi:hypothetical protein